MGRKMVATSASLRLSTARCLACERGVQDQQGGTPLLDRGEVGHDLLQLVVDVFGVQLGFAGGARQGLDERRPGREVPAWREDPPDDRGPAPYHGDLGQLLVVGFVQHPLLGCIQPLSSRSSSSRASAENWV